MAGRKRRCEFPHLGLGVHCECESAMKCPAAREVDRLRAECDHHNFQAGLLAREAGELMAEVERLRELLREVSGPIGDDPRLDYVTVQIGRTAYMQMVDAARRKQEGE